MQLMSSFSPQVQANDPLLSGNSPRGKVCLLLYIIWNFFREIIILEKEMKFHYINFFLQVMHVDGHVGGYPIKFLEQIVRLSKCLKKKRELIGSLRDLNAQGEKRKSFRDDFNEDFQRRYASNVLELSEVNRDLNEHLRSIQEFTQEV